MKYNYEVKKEIDVIDEFDVVVVGGGLGGICAALSAADLGMKTALIERNATIGGQAAEVNTWGLDGFVDCNGKMLVKGYPWEILKRTVARGNSDPFWNKINMDTLQKDGEEIALKEMGAVEYVPFIHTNSFMNPFNDQYVDVNDYKITAIKMLEEKNVMVLLGMPVVDTIIEGKDVKGVVLQGELDKFAVMAKRVVDTTQSSIVCAYAGKTPRLTDMYMGTLPRVTGVDIGKVIDYIEETDENWFVRPMVGKRADPQELRSLVSKGYPLALHGFTTALNKAIEDDPKYKNLVGTKKADQIFFYEKENSGAFWIFTSNFRFVDPTNPIALATAVKTGRKQQMLTCEFFKKYVPGFENVMIIDEYPNISRAYKNSFELTNFTEYSVTQEEILSGKSTQSDNIIKVLGHPHIGGCGEGWWLTLRSLIPKDMNNIIISGKSACRRIHYIATCGLVGQAAGASAAESIIEGKDILKTSSHNIREKLISQGVILD